MLYIPLFSEAWRKTHEEGFLFSTDSDYETLEISIRNLTREKQLVGFGARRWNDKITELEREIGEKRDDLCFPLSREMILKRRAQSYDRFHRDSNGMASTSPNTRFKDETTRFRKTKLMRPIKNTIPANIAHYDLHYKVPLHSSSLLDFERFSNLLTSDNSLW